MFVMLGCLFKCSGNRKHIVHVEESLTEMQSGVWVPVQACTCAVAMMQVRGTCGCVRTHMSG
jgi:hypothetical protein